MFGLRSTEEEALQTKITRLNGELNDAQEKARGIINGLQSDIDKQAAANKRIREEHDDKISALNDDISKLELKKKMDEEDIRHMIKMKEERQELAFKKDRMDADKEHADALALEKAECAKAIAKVRKECADKVDKLLTGQIGDIKGMYSDIVKMLPDVNARLQIKSKD